MKLVKEAFKCSIPGGLAYFPMGVIYALLFIKHGYPGWLCPFFGLFIYAGAIQFLALTLVAIGTPLPMIALSVLPLAIRNSFYGITMLERYKQAGWFRKSYLAQSLVDATYSTLLTGPRYEGENDLRYCTYLSLFIQFEWILGIFAGLLLNYWIAMPPRVEFCLTTFFAASALEMMLKRFDLRVVSIAAAGLVIAYTFTPNYLFLSSIALCFIGCALLPQKQEVTT